MNKVTVTNISTAGVEFRSTGVGNFIDINNFEAIATTSAINLVFEVSHNFRPKIATLLGGNYLINLNSDAPTADANWDNVNDAYNIDRIFCQNMNRTGGPVSGSD